MQQAFALIDLTVFNNGCKLSLFGEDGLQQIENKVGREVNLITSRIIGKVELVLLKSFPNDNFAKKLEIELKDLGFKIQKL